MAEASARSLEIMTDEMFEQNHERVFHSGSPIDGLIDPNKLKDIRREDIADTVSLVRPKLLERFPALEIVDPQVIDELAVYIGFFARGSLEDGIRIGHDETVKHRRRDPNSPESVLASQHDIGV